MKHLAFTLAFALALGLAGVAHAQEAPAQEEPVGETADHGLFEGLLESDDALLFVGGDALIVSDSDNPWKLGLTAGVGARWGPTQLEVQANVTRDTATWSDADNVFGGHLAVLHLRDIEWARLGAGLSINVGPLAAPGLMGRLQLDHFHVTGRIGMLGHQISTGIIF